MQLTLNRDHLEIMRQQVLSCSPQEACGLLAGKDGWVTEVFSIANKAQSPVRFRMDPIEQLNAFNRMEAAGLDLLGIYHSHPSGPETMSATDIAEAAYSVVQIIWSLSNPQFTEAGLQISDSWHARAYWIDNGKVIEVTLQITEDE